MRKYMGSRPPSPSSASRDCSTDPIGNRSSITSGEPMRPSARWLSPREAGPAILKIASAAANLARPHRNVAVDQKRLERSEQQPRLILGARRRLLFGSPRQLAQLLEHESGHGGVFAALDSALELPHQQRLRLRRELREIVLHPLVRCLAHAPCRIARETVKASTPHHKCPGVKKSLSERYGKSAAYAAWRAGLRHLKRLRNFPGCRGFTSRATTPSANWRMHRVA